MGWGDTKRKTGVVHPIPRYSYNDVSTGITFRVSPPGYALSWHCAPRRQYSITLAGEAEIEVGDGTIKRIGPGDVLLAEDLTGQGHITRVVGTQQRFYVVVPLEDEQP